MVRYFEMIFLSTGSPFWNSYDELYDLNEDAHLDQNGDMIYTIPTRHDLLEEADISALDAARPSSRSAIEYFDDKDDCIDAIIASSIIGSVN